jgi:NADPH-dependent glutamate synthase beta subunit-like oxidoreductase/glutamate synthase domain-containing protein 3/NAD-dependent dihydropyrimidine dehydrogenase PreA subunit
MSDQQTAIIRGKEMGERLESRILEEQIQKAVAQGFKSLSIHAFGQHGIGGRLFREDGSQLHITVDGPAGQRLGSMGFEGTRIDVMGPASDDVGWLNAGAEIVIHGNAGNGVANAMAQGKVMVAGNIGARGMTMTKQNPRFDPPELWVLGSVGDYFGEFMAGGIAVVCGIDGQDPDNVLGYRPFVGMVGGRVFFRGPHKGYSRPDARIVPIEAGDWQWLEENLNAFLNRIDRSDVFESLSDPAQWQMLRARTPREKVARQRRSMADFRSGVWDGELGQGGLIGDLTALDRSPVPLLTTGALRRFVPVWENRKYAPPCQAACPTGIPVQERWRLIREGRMDEAVDLALAYTPFPATVCGYLCPNLCMQSCTRQIGQMAPLDITGLGKASIAAKLPELPDVSGGHIAVIGGGPAGLSVAWQLRQRGHDVTLFDKASELGGKIIASIPGSRIPEAVVRSELDRVQQTFSRVNLQQPLEKADVEQLAADHDFVVVAVGAQRPRTLPVPGAERTVSSLDFLKEAKAGTIDPGKRVVIIGAGNVGCDVATEAHRLGAGEIVLLDVQKPLAFGREKEDAEAVGAVFRWPCFTREITGQGVVLASGEVVAADTVVLSIGDAPDLAFLPESVALDRGFVQTDDFGQTTDPKIFAIGDAVRPGLLTDAIGSGRKAAAAMDDILSGRRPAAMDLEMIDRSRVSLAYFDPRMTDHDDIAQCGDQCASCGACRDCGICVAVCPQSAISRKETAGGDGFEYVVDADRCIGCGFCGGACPCGIWNLLENTPMG